MKRSIVALVATLTIAPAVAQGRAPTRRHARQYTHLYHVVALRYSARTPGRNIIRDGLSTGRAPTDADVVRSTVVLERMLAPPPPPPAPAPVAAPVPTSTVSPTGAGAAGVPACASESGTNYSTGAANTNASSGATGRYQITPGTSAAYGCDLSTPAGQDACAATIYQHQGAGAWVGCGG